LQVDPIVNAANTSLLGGGGVDGRSIGLRGLSFLPNAVDWAAVHQGRVGSPTGVVCRPPTSSTRGADLTGRTEQQLLESCYRSRLDITCRQGFRKIAFPAELVTFVCFDGPTLDAYRDALGAKVY
jgi:O-acetyl-ADP-ribose deacetylase (regulator of RNase III)